MGRGGILIGAALPVSMMWCVMLVCPICGENSDLYNSMTCAMDG